MMTATGAVVYLYRKRSDKYRNPPTSISGGMNAKLHFYQRESSLRWLDDRMFQPPELYMSSNSMLNFGTQAKVTRPVTTPG